MEITNFALASYIYNIYVYINSSKYKNALLQIKYKNVKSYK